MEANGSEIYRRARLILFRQEHNIGPVDTIKLDVALVEGFKQSSDGRSGNGPSGFVKGGLKTIRSWAREGPHLVEGTFDFVSTERVVQEGEIRGWFRVEST